MFDFFPSAAETITREIIGLMAANARGPAGVIDPMIARFCYWRWDIGASSEDLDIYARTDNDSWE